MSIDYELAKELTEAHFLFDSPEKLWVRYWSQETKQNEYHLCDNNLNDWRVEQALETYPVPTLEELLEACGANFGTLGYYTEGGQPTPDIAWKAFGGGTTAYGATPISAVARLWITLEKLVL